MQVLCKKLNIEQSCRKIFTVLNKGSNIKNRGTYIEPLSSICQQFKLKISPIS